jgi:type I restriction enzyme S subunit
VQLADLYLAPEEWQRTRIDALAKPVRQMVDPEKLGAREVFHISIPAFDRGGEGEVQPAGSIESKKLSLAGGEVILARLNPRKGRVTLVSPRSLPILASGEFVALRPHPECEPRFLAWLLRSQTVSQWLDSQVRSVTRSHQRVDPQALTHAQLWAPPFEEQRRIANFLDLEVAKVDRLSNLKKKLAGALSRRLDAAMQAAIRDLPREAKLGYVCSWLSGGTPPKEESEHWTGPVPWASTKDLATDDLRDTLDHVTEEAVETYSRLAPAKSILIATRGMALAKRIPLAVTRCPVAFNQDLKALVPTPGIEADYLRIAVRGYQSDLLASVVEAAHGTRRLETRHIKALRIPLPAPSIQRRIAEEVREVEADTQKAEKALRRQLTLLEDQREALITAVVTGPLEASPGSVSAVAA